MIRTMNVRMPENLYIRLKKHSADHQMSAATVVREAIEMWLGCYYNEQSHWMPPSNSLMMQRVRREIIQQLIKMGDE